MWIASEEGLLWYKIQVEGVWFDIRLNFVKKLLGLGSRIWFCNFYIYIYNNLFLIT